MTDDKYAPLRAAEAKTTKGPWAVDRAAYSNMIIGDDSTITAQMCSIENADFIVQARNLVPDLLRERDELVGYLKALACPHCTHYRAGPVDYLTCQNKNAYDAFLRREKK